MRTIEQLFNKHAVDITDLDYNDIMVDYKEGFIMVINDIDLDELLNYFIDISPIEVEQALYNTTLSFYTYNNEYMAVFQS